jgi:glycosyltransferase involved in cell wall biosynthesis
MSDSSQTPIVDVVIPTLGGGRFIREAVDSVRQQSMRRWSLFVAGNGVALDHLIAAVGELPGAGGVEIDAIEENIGQARNWTRAIGHGHAPYVALLCDDDRWEPTFLEDRVRFLEQHRDCAFVFSGFVRIDETGRTLAESELLAPTGGLQPESFVPLLFQRNVISTPSLVVRREAYDAVGPHYDERFMMIDYEMMLRLAVRFPVGYLAQRDCAMRVHPKAFSNSSWRQFDSNQWVQFAEHAERLVDRFMAPGTLPARLRRRRRAFYELAAAMSAAEQCSTGDALRYLTRGVRTDPTALFDSQVAGAFLGRVRRRRDQLLDRRMKQS